jgi:hypothetical protein
LPLELETTPRPSEAPAEPRRNRPFQAIGLALLAVVALSSRAARERPLVALAGIAIYWRC